MDGARSLLQLLRDQMHASKTAEAGPHLRIKVLKCPVLGRGMVAAYGVCCEQGGTALRRRRPPCGYSRDAIAFKSGCVHSLWHMAHTAYTEYIAYTAYGHMAIWRIAYGVQRMAYGIWRTSWHIWRTAPGVWHMAYMAYGGSAYRSAAYGVYPPKVMVPNCGASPCPRIRA